MTTANREIEKSSPGGHAPREMKRAEALRENLRKRKAQQQIRQQAPADSAPAPTPPKE